MCILCTYVRVCWKWDRDRWGSVNYKYVVVLNECLFVTKMGNPLLGMKKKSLSLFFHTIKLFFTFGSACQKQKRFACSEQLSELPLTKMIPSKTIICQESYDTKNFLIYEGIFVERLREFCVVSCAEVSSKIQFESW